MIYGRRVPRLVVVLPLIRLRTGDGFPLKTWPLHVTVAPTFVTDADAAAVAVAIRPAICGCPPLTVTGGAEEGFGPSGRVPVTVLVPSAELSALHELLRTALGAVRADFDDPAYIGAGYRGHVTSTAVARMTPGDVALLAQAAIVDMEPVGLQRLRRVTWVSALNGQ